MFASTLNFSNLSISGMQMNMHTNGGNRPPALSVSSISSVGEELNMPQKSEFAVSYNNNGNNGMSTLAQPSSPLSSASARSSNAHGSHSWNNSALNSPTVGVNGCEGTYSKSLPTFKELAEESDAPTGMDYNSIGTTFRSSFDDKWIGNRSHGYESRDQHLRLHGSNPDSGYFNNSENTPSRSTNSSRENSSTFSSWQPSNGNNRIASTHSLNNMGSVDENEQYLGNRARASSAAATLEYQRQHLIGSFTPKLSSSLPLNNTGFEDVHRLSLNENSGTNDITYNSPRQRVMSADAVHSVSLRNQNFHDFNQSNTFSRSLDPSNARYLNSDYNNRPRSFSSGSKATLFNANVNSDRPNYETLSSGRAPDFSSRPVAHRNHFIGTRPSYSQQHQLSSNIVDFNGGIGAGNEMMHTPQGIEHEPQYGGYATNPPAARAVMYEQFRPQEMGHSNQDRTIGIQHSAQEHMNSTQYYHGQEAYMNKIHIYHGGGMGTDTNAIASPRTVYTVKFKRSQKNFFLSDHLKGDIKIGSYVKVEADRGEDLGIVLSRIPIEKFNPGARLNAPNLGIPDLQLKRINRLASDEEIALLSLKKEEEAELLKICKSKTLQRGLPMNVVDAEYQFDRHKLTFFFEANCRVDFRELVRDLFSIYKTRIWMQQIDKVPGSPLPLGSMTSGSTKNLPTYGIDSVASNNSNSSNRDGRFGTDSSATNAGACHCDSHLTNEAESRGLLHDPRPGRSN